MLVTITALKAPWPAGAVVGSVVEVQAANLPGCFLGKCKPAEDDAEPAFAWEPTAAMVGEFVQKPAAPANADELQSAKSLQAAAEEEAAELRAMVERLTAQLVEKDDAIKVAQAAADAAGAPKAGGKTKG